MVSPETEVVYARGCDVTGDSAEGFADAIAAASGADAAVVVLGENEWQAEGRQGTSGEAFDSATLELTGRQEELLKGVHATGTPTVLVLINGRPLAIRWAAAHIPSILEAWCPGEKGGQAVAEVLFGLVEPEGRLPVTVPRHAGQLPVAYNYPKAKEYWITKGWGNPYVDLDPAPLYAFGHGLTYTTFAYELLEVVPSLIQPGDDFKVRVGLRNTGRRPGTELVQIYIRDLVSSVATPVQKLVGFRKVRLEPGAREVVEIRIPGDRLALLDASLQWTVEPGEFEVRAARSAVDIQLRSGLVVAGSAPAAGGRPD
jgi:beta-glucosidase